jgi:hypothetical protein
VRVGGHARETDVAPGEQFSSEEAEAFETEAWRRRMLDREAKVADGVLTLRIP